MSNIADTRPVGRRRLLLGGAGSALGAGLGLALDAQSSAQAGRDPRRGHDKRPSVLWIITDDQTRRSLRRMRKTMNRLVDRGVHFPHGYTAVPLCGPSRVSLLTSMYAHNHGANSNWTLPGFVRRHLDTDTVATRMAGAGYKAGYFGKYMNGHDHMPEYVAPGWRRWVALVDAERLFNVDGDLRRINVERRSADEYAVRRCLDFIRAHDTVPWFAVFAPTSPHDPYAPSRRHRHDFDGIAWDPPAFNERNLHDKPAFMAGIPRQDRRQMRRIWEDKLEELQDVDDQVGRLLDAIAGTGQLGSTVVMMVSDNGYLLGEHRLFKKEQPYEEATGIPFLVRGPRFDARAAGALVSSVDLMPTTLELAGLDPDAGRELDGRSMVANLRSGHWSDWRKRLIAEDTRWGWTMLREGDRVFVHHYGRDGEVELYDLGDDPYQMRSMAARVDTARYQATARALRNAAGRQLRALEV